MFFIVGRGRSGTTLLRSLFNAHPKAAVAPEGMFLMALKRRYGKGPWNERRIRAFARDLWRETRLRDWRLDRAELLETMLALGDRASFSELCRLVYERYAIEQGKPQCKVIGDKNPHYSLFIGSVREVFPEAQVIHVVRDYRDNVLSYQKVTFDLSGNAALAYRWRAYNDAIADATASLGERLLVVRYEDLVADPARELQRISAFLGIEYCPDMVTEYRRGDVPSVAWHANLGKGIDRGRIEAWRKRMSLEDVRRAEQICGPCGLRYGYLTTTRIRWWVRIAVVPALVWASSVTLLERVFFRVPFAVQWRMLFAYRWMTGTLDLGGSHRHEASSAGSSDGL